MTHTLTMAMEATMVRKHMIRKRMNQSWEMIGISLALLQSLILIPLTLVGTPSNPQASLRWHAGHHPNSSCAANSRCQGLSSRVQLPYGSWRSMRGVYLHSQAVFSVYDVGVNILMPSCCQCCTVVYC